MRDPCELHISDLEAILNADVGGFFSEGAEMLLRQCRRGKRRNRKKRKK
jgi:hypothetical protein